VSDKEASSSPADTHPQEREEASGEARQHAPDSFLTKASGVNSDQAMSARTEENARFQVPKASVILAWLLVLIWTLFIFWGSGANPPDEPVSKPVTQPIIEPIVEPINEARGEPLSGPGYDKVDHACEYGILGALLWMALALTAHWRGSPPWLADLRHGWRGYGQESEEEAHRTFKLHLARLLPPLVLAAALLASLYGATDELHQAFVAERTADARDWMADTIGGLLGAMVMALVAPPFGRLAGRELVARGYIQHEEREISEQGGMGQE